VDKNRIITLVSIGVLFVVITGVIYINNRSRDTVLIDPAPYNGSETENYDGSNKDDTTDAIIMVYIAGCVKNPGVYEVKNGSRVTDVLDAAGGATDEADLKAINLAARVKDEDKIIVPNISENLSGSQAGAQNESGLININTATKEELKTLPGVGDVRAGNIIAYREKNGNFNSIEDIMNVPNIGKGIYAQIMDYITV